MADVLMLTTYPPQDASTRRRVYAVAVELQRQGISCRVDHLVSARLYAIKNTDGLRYRIARVGLLLVALLRRIVLIARFDSRVVVVHREAFPFCTPVFERLVRRRALTLILDVDDGLHESAPGGGDWRSFARSPESFLEVVAMADMVLACSPELIHAYAPIARETRLALTSPDPLVIEAGQRRRSICWIGSQSTLHNVQPLLKELLDYCDANDAVLEILGGSNVLDLPAHPRLSAQVWSLDRQNSLLTQASVGIMPLSQDGWDRFKGGYKLLLYLAAGVPAIASPVGINVWLAEQIPSGVTLAYGDDWVPQIAHCLELADRNGDPLSAAMRWVEENASPRISADFIAAYVRLTPPSRPQGRRHNWRSRSN